MLYEVITVREGVAGVPPTESETGASAGPVSEATSLVIDGVTWTVRVRGRGRLGADTGPAPLLVLEVIGHHAIDLIALKRLSVNSHAVRPPSSGRIATAVV